jgi:hypothetical protein
MSKNRKNEEKKVSQGSLEDLEERNLFDLGQQLKVEA